MHRAFNPKRCNEEKKHKTQVKRLRKKLSKRHKEEEKRAKVREDRKKEAKRSLFKHKLRLFLVITGQLMLISR